MRANKLVFCHFFTGYLQLCTRNILCCYNILCSYSLGTIYGVRNVISHGNTCGTLTAQCPAWLFSTVPWCRAFQLRRPDIL